MEGRNGVGDFCGRAEQSPAPTGLGDVKGRYKEIKGRNKETKRGMQKGKDKKKKKKKQAVSAIIRESGAFWERPKRTGVKRRVKA